MASSSKSIVSFGQAQCFLMDTVTVDILSQHMILTSSLLNGRSDVPADGVDVHELKYRRIGWSSPLVVAAPV